MKFMEFSAVTIYGLVEEIKSRSKKALFFSFIYPLFIPLTVILLLFLLSFLLVNEPSERDSFMFFLSTIFGAFLLPIVFTSSLIYVALKVFLSDAFRKYPFLDNIALPLSTIFGVMLGLWGMVYFIDIIGDFLVYVANFDKIVASIVFILLISLPYYFLPFYTLTYYAYKKPQKIVDSLLNAQEINISNEKEKLVYQVFDNMRIAFGIPTNKVSLKVLPWDVINAMVISSRDESTVYITRAAIEKLNYNELEALFAHEFSHIKNQDGYYLSSISIAGAFSMILAWYFMVILPKALLSAAKGNRRGNEILYIFALVSFIAGAIFSFITPFVFRRILGDVSKRREALADISAVLVTKHPPSFLDLLIKVAKEDTSNFIKQNKIPMNIQALLFDFEYETHPKIWERIEYICKYTNTPFPNEYYELKNRNV